MFWTVLMQFIMILRFHPESWFDCIKCCAWHNFSLVMWCDVIRSHALRSAVLREKTSMKHIEFQWFHLQIWQETLIVTPDSVNYWTKFKGIWISGRSSFISRRVIVQIHFVSQLLASDFQMQPRFWTRLHTPSCMKSVLNLFQYGSKEQKLASWLQCRETCSLTFLN